MRLSVTVPIQLVKQDDSYFLVVKNNAGHEAQLSLGEVLTLQLQQDIFRSWADEQMQAALMKRRRPTGLLDAGGRQIFEGDILLLKNYFQLYPNLPAAVVWSKEDAAFVLEGSFADSERTFHSDNLRPATMHRIIGNVFNNPELLTPAERFVE